MSRPLRLWADLPARDRVSPDWLAENGLAPWIMHGGLCAAAVPLLGLTFGGRLRFHPCRNTSVKGEPPLCWQHRTIASGKSIHREKQRRTSSTGRLSAVYRQRTIAAALDSVLDRHLEALRSRRGGYYTTGLALERELQRAYLLFALNQPGKPPSTA